MLAHDQNQWPARTNFCGHRCIFADRGTTAPLSVCVRVFPVPDPTTQWFAALLHLLYLNCPEELFFSDKVYFSGQGLHWVGVTRPRVVWYLGQLAVDSGRSPRLLWRVHAHSRILLDFLALWVSPDKCYLLRAVRSYRKTGIKIMY